MPTSGPPRRLSQPPARRPLTGRPNDEARDTQVESFQEESEPEPHGRRRQTFGTPSTRSGSPPPFPPLAPFSPPYPHITPTTRPLAPPPKRRNHRTILSTLLSKRKRHTTLHHRTDHSRKTSGRQRLQQQNNAKVTQQCLSPNKGLYRAKGQGIYPPSSTSSKNLHNRVAASPDKENLPPEDEKLLHREPSNDDEGAADEMHKDVGGAGGCSQSAPVSGSTCRGCSHSYCDCDCDCSYDYDYDYGYCYPSDSWGDSLSSQVVLTRSPSRTTTIPSDGIWWWNDTDNKMRASTTRGSNGLTTRARLYNRQQPPQQEQQQEQGQTFSPTSQGLVVRRPLNMGAEERRKARPGSLLARPPASASTSSSTPLRKSFPSAATNTRSRLFEGTISSRSKMVGAPPAIMAATRATAAQEPRRASGINPTPPRRVRWTSKFENLRAQGNREQLQPQPQLQQTRTKRESTGLRAAPAPAPAPAPAIGSRRESFRRNSQLAPPAAAAPRLPSSSIGPKREPPLRRNSQLGPPVVAPAQLSSSVIGPKRESIRRNSQLAPPPAAAAPRLPSSSVGPKREPLRRNSQLAPRPAPSQLPSSSPPRLRATHAQKEDNSGSGSGNRPGSIRAGPPAPRTARPPLATATTAHRKPTVTVTQDPQQPLRRITLHRAQEEPKKQLLTPTRAPPAATTTTTPRRSFTHTRIASLPSIVKSLNRPKLIAGPKSFAQVWEARPPAYWLGRFVTLTNAFHYEDSFRQPDAATGSPGMLSSYPQRPLAGADAAAAVDAHANADADADDGDLPNSRVKRAFMLLENVCVTDEASGGLRRFRDAYVARFGDRWMD
ncbi:uncharacterized protein BO66DRAFT_470060 [Aspergillus aculeatinus CBS 121060]|uniref:Uncharacterized protein n=1 Tax=Aspergillus aculeatinus CBS 121060 TaxID=1448322 RepID=A0ACD1HF34_9EURO|nr:hypothetical protein BO66DRAFT_470060 [Aspergillus aculeatinus CBS 121060]RAH71981.1 hypothetical protein BO66DRAFT_470060 [Aspergillus aculeatinus CBS 121060]